MARYANCKIRFLEIGNIHAMRGSVDALRDMCLSTQLPESNWLASLQVLYCFVVVDECPADESMRAERGDRQACAGWRLMRRVRVFFFNIFMNKYVVVEVQSV